MFSKWMKMDEDVDSFKNLVSTIKLDEHFSSVLYRNPVFSKCFTAFEQCKLFYSILYYSRLTWLTTRESNLT